MMDSINPQLHDQLKGILQEAWAEKHSEVVFTGETFSTDALVIARAYERATGQQQAALRSVIELWEKLP